MPEDDVHGTAMPYNQHTPKSPDGPWRKCRPEKFTLNLEETEQKKINLTNFLVHEDCDKK